MSLAPWRSPLARALHRNRSRIDSRYPQLATVRPNGRPANRTIVFRGFVPQSNDLYFVSDQRSDKVQQLALNPAVEVCWYFPQTREQFRLGGEMQVITADTPPPFQPDIRQQTWAALSDRARQQFAWPPPGQPRTSQGFEVEAPDAAIPLETFAVLLLSPDTVDHLALKGDPQDRTLYRRRADGSWDTHAINP